MDVFANSFDLDVIISIRTPSHGEEKKIEKYLFSEKLSSTYYFSMKLVFKPHIYMHTTIQNFALI